MKTAHTPGPWSLGKIEGNFIEIDAHGDDPHWGLASVVWKMEDDERTPKCEANARLISAAPDLLSALQSIVEMNPSLPMGMIEAAQDAIAKATGAE